jgi:hypothetical protein
MKPHFGHRPEAKKGRAGFLASLVATVGLIIGSIGTVALAPSASAAPLTCTASMSNTAPKTRTYVDVLVSTAARAAVTTTANYKTTKNTKHEKATVLGKARVPYYISTATPGFTVVVNVVVMSGGKSARCSTKFVPQARK